MCILTCGLDLFGDCAVVDMGLVRLDCSLSPLPLHLPFSLPPLLPHPGPVFSLVHGFCDCDGLCLLERYMI